MGKKAREYKSGDFIFAKVKGYPAWPARVQRLNGKKYFVYFYGTGETANLPVNQIFDYAENKDKFLTKTVKRKDFNDGVRQIEHDFANNVPLEEILGVNPEEPMDTSVANDSANATGADSTLDATADSVGDVTANETNTTAQNETAAVEDSDDGALIIDEGKKNKKAAGKTPATPKTVKEARTPRGQKKKEDPVEELKRDEEIISRSGRKIRPKRYIDEQTEDNATLPSPAPKKKRVASPVGEKTEKVKSTDTASAEKANKHYNAVAQSELEDLKEPFVPEDTSQDNILIAHLPSGQYVGIKLFQSRPSTYKSDAARLQWDRQAAANAITLKSQLEKGHITAQSVCGQLEMDLNLTDEEKANLDKEREIEEKKCRVQFLKTEMKLIEIDAKIKSCLSLEKADTDLCLKLLDELNELEVKSLMLLKHPTCLETLKRMRAYVGNTPSWQLTEDEALNFSKQAQLIRTKADTTYLRLKELFETPEGLSFWEFFSERVSVFKKATAKLTSDERLEMIHEPIEMSQPTAHTMKAAIEAANADTPIESEEATPKKKATPVKNKKATATTPTKAVKRQSSRSKAAESEENNKNEASDETTAENTDQVDSSKPGAENSDEQSIANTEEPEKVPEAKTTKESAKNAKESAKNAKDSAKNTKEKKGSKNVDESKSQDKEDSTQQNNTETNNKEDNAGKNSEDSEMTNDSNEESTAEKSVEIDSADKEKTDKSNDSDKEKTNDLDKPVKDVDEKKDAEINDTEKEGNDTEKEKNDTGKEKNDSGKEKNYNDKEKNDSGKEKNDTEKDTKEAKQKDKEDSGEPRAKRSRDSIKKSEATSTKSPLKRKLRS